MTKWCSGCGAEMPPGSPHHKVTDPGHSGAPKDESLNPCWFCRRGFTLDYLIAGYDTFEEQRLACLDCDRTIKALHEKGWLPSAPPVERADTTGLREAVEALIGEWADDDAAIWRDQVPYLVRTEVTARLRAALAEPEHGWHNDGDSCTGPGCINPEHDDADDPTATPALP